MPSSRARCDATKPAKTLFLRAHLFSASSQKSKFVSVPTLEVGEDRYPLVEAFFSEQQRQPYIHDCLVTLSSGHQKHQFRVFCKNHKFLQTNQSLPGGFQSWRGDLLVMRGGVKCFGVNLRARDNKLVNRVVKYFLWRSKQQTPFRLPQEISIV